MLQDGSVDLLARLPLFAGMDVRALESIIYMNARRAFQPHEALVSVNQYCAGAYFIVHGAATRISTDGQAAGTAYGPGSLIEEMAMFTQIKPDKSIVATEFVLAVEITQPVMGDILRFDPGLAEVLINRIEGRLSELETRLKQIDQMLIKALPAEVSSDQIPPEPEHGQTASPSRAPRPQPSSSVMSPATPGTPRHGPAVGPDLTGASLLHDSSTR